MLHTKVPKVYSITQSLLRKLGYLRVPIDASKILNIDINKWADLRNMVVAVNENYMKNVALKFDDPFKTGECSCT